MLLLINNFDNELKKKLLIFISTHKKLINYQYFEDFL